MKQLLIDEILSSANEAQFQPETSLMGQSMRTILDKDPDLEDALLATPDGQEVQLENASQRILELVQRLMRLNNTQIPTVLRFAKNQTTPFDSRKLREIADLIVYTANPREDKAYCVGAYVRTIIEPTRIIPIPKGTIGIIKRWHLGYVAVQFTQDGRQLEYLYRTNHLKLT